MLAATWLLFALGLLGALDIALFHTLAHGIRRHPGCRRELVPHALRGPTYALLFLVLPNLELHGAWFWALLALLAFDLAISWWDFAIERQSRALLGGLPTGEYVLHVTMAMLFGAFVAAVIVEGGDWSRAPTEIVASSAVPVLLRLTLAVMAAGVAVSGVQDALAWRRLCDDAPVS